MKSTTRRGVLGAIAVAPVVCASGAAATITIDNPDAKLLTAFRARQQALAAIELRGDFFDCEEHSPAFIRTYDQAELVVVETPAATLPGVLAKLWVALDAAGGSVRCAWQHRHHDIFRRADLAALEGLNFRDFEYDERVIAEAIVSLSRIVEG